MKKLLFVNCCVRPASRTRRLAESYLEAVRAAGEFEIEEVFVPELGLKPFDAAMLAARNADVEAKRMDGEAYALARQWKAADRIVIAAPFWDISFPSMLKVYFEHISVERLTFGFGPGGRQKFCKADKLVYIASCGGPLAENNSLKAFVGELAEMFAVDDWSFHCAEKMDSDPDHMEENLAKAAEKLLAEV